MVAQCPERLHGRKASVGILIVERGDDRIADQFVDRSVDRSRSEQTSDHADRRQSELRVGCAQHGPELGA